MTGTKLHMHCRTFFVYMYKQDLSCCVTWSFRLSIFWNLQICTCRRTLLLLQCCTESIFNFAIIPFCQYNIIYRYCRPLKFEMQGATDPNPDWLLICVREIYVFFPADSFVIPLPLQSHRISLLQIVRIALGIVLFKK